MTCFSRTRFIGQQRVTWFILHPTISGHFEGDNLITSWSCEVFYQDIFDGQLIANTAAYISGSQILVFTH